MYGMWVIPECTTENVVNGIAETILTYDHRREEMFSNRKLLDWKYVAGKLHKFYENIIKINEKYTSEKTKQLYIKLYNHVNL